MEVWMNEGNQGKMLFLLFWNLAQTQSDLTHASVKPNVS